VTTSGGPLADFGVQATLVGEQAVLALRGDLDISGAPELGAYFDAVIASGHLSVVLDLSELDLMGPAGLTVIAYGASRLVASGGVLASQIWTIEKALDEHGATERRDLAQMVGARYWGPGVFREALREAIAEGTVRRTSRSTYEPVQGAARRGDEQ